MSRLLGALAAFVGGLIGVELVLSPSTALFSAVGVAFAVAVVALIVATWRFGRDPVFYGMLMELWALFYPAAAAGLVWLFLKLTVVIHADRLIQLPGWTSDQEGELVKYVVGLFVTLIAALAPTEADKPEAWIWTANRFRAASRKIGPRDARRGEATYYAAQMPSTRDNTATGWGFGARRARAKLLRAWTEANPNANPSLGAKLPARRDHR